MTLEPLTLPSHPDDWAALVADRADGELQRARDAVAALKDGSLRTPEQVLEVWNDGDIGLHNATSLVSVLAQVHPEESVRSLAEEREQEATRFATERGQDRELFQALAAVDLAGLDAQAHRLLNKTLRDFRRSGVDQDEAVRDRLREISERVTVVGQDFSRNVRDAVGSIRITPDRLAGLPQDFVDAHPPGDDGLVTITTDYPDWIPFRTFAQDAAARRELTTVFLCRAWPDNDELLHELLELRAEQAGLLGYADWAEFDAEVKMIGSGKAIPEFIDRIAALSEGAARRDYQVLLERARRDDPDTTQLTAADAGYYAELVRRENFDVDAQQVRRYLPFDRVRAGLLEVTGRLFGVEYRAVPDASVWHPDVACYDVMLAGDSAVLGRIYLDLHPREGKYKHAAQFDLVAGVTGRQLPEGVLACNFSRGLMEHTDVVTLFHEFGHLVHHILGGRQRWVRFSGVATEWDFVEAPSQLLEEWAWDAGILRSFATDGDGQPIPTELVGRMRAAKEFGKGYLARTQMFYAAVSYQLHLDRPADLTAAVEKLQARYDLFGTLPGTHFQDSFGHLEAYTSAYYTYMWSLVIAKDMFSAFHPDDLFDAGVAHRYRDEILAPGGSEDAAALVANFLGRQYSFDAFGAWLDRPVNAPR
ncbi:MAG: thimet oligopeptidase [Pseudonocardiales bacterium]|nr:thimet oligopeptidase [Pseudonocardiales bacterium]